MVDQNEDEHWEAIQDFLINLASGKNIATGNPVFENNEQLMALQTGITMLVEELKSTTVSRSFFNSIYNGINDIIIVFDRQGNIQNTNRIANESLGFSKFELLEQPIRKLMQIDSIIVFNNAIINQWYQKDIGLNFVTKQNKIIPVSCSFSALYDDDKQSENVLLVAKNIATLLETKEQLAAKNDELNLFVYKASHDLKSPISSMQGLMSLVNQSNDLDELKEYYGMVSDCLVKFDSIIMELLVLGRITYGELKYEMVDIKKTIDGILSSLQFVNGFNDITFNITISDDAQLIKTEEGLINTILHNLIDNAIKYRQSNISSYVNIDITKGDNEIVIKLKDNGIGIDKALHSKLFKMFYRATNEASGSGLGLYIVKTGVLKLGGRISVDGDLGEGTAFEIHLPILN